MDSFMNRINNFHNFVPDQHIPDLSSKVIIVTGGNAGIGRQTVLELAKHEPKIYLTARSRSKYDLARIEILKAVPDAKVEFLELDLASFSSVKKAADTFLASNSRLDILINNAGIMGAPAELTSNGYETHFGTNHMGHALFTKLLTPLLLKTAKHSDVRVVNVSSEAIQLAPKAGFLPDQIVTPWASKHSYVRYGHSKLANVLHAKAFAKHNPSITSVSIHPGRVESQLLDNFNQTTSFTGYYQKFYDWMVGVLPVEQGAWSQLWAATWKKEDIVNGAYYLPVGKLSCSDARINDDALVERLWVWTDEEFQKHGY